VPLPSHLPLRTRPRFQFEDELSTGDVDSMLMRRGHCYVCARDDNVAVEGQLKGPRDAKPIDCTCAWACTQKALDFCVWHRTQ